MLDHNLVSFIRKKDKIKGWYICYWDFNEQSIPFLEEKLRLQTLEKLKARLATEDSGIFYMCRYAHVRMKFDDAFEENFKCPECGELMNEVDNGRTIEFLQNRIKELESASVTPKVAKPAAKPKTITKKKVSSARAKAKKPSRTASKSKLVESSKSAKAIKA